MGTSDASTNESPREAEQPREGPRSDARHTSKTLLREAVAALGMDRLSEALGVTEAHVQQLLAATTPMPLPQQRVLGMAVLVLSGECPALRRRAAALIRQVGAAEDYAAGLTARHNHAPPGRWP